LVGRSLPTSVVRFSCRHSTTVILAGVFVAGLATLGVRRLQVETATDSVLDRDSSSWGFYEHSQELFGEDETIVVALDSRRARSPDSLARVAELTRAFERLPGVRRVDSLFTVPIVRSSTDGSLVLDPAFSDDLESAEVDAGFAAASADRIAPRILFSDDEKTLAINLYMEADNEEGYATIVDAVANATAADDARMSGVPVFRVATDLKTRSEIMVFVPLTVVVMAVLLAVLFGSMTAVGISLLTSGMATWCLLSLMGLLGTRLSVTTAILPPVTLGLGSAYVMHFLSKSRKPREGARPDIGQLAGIAGPVALSGLTTAVGFLAISGVPIGAIRDVGMWGSIGSVLITSASLTLAPAALTRWPVDGDRGFAQRFAFIANPLARRLGRTRRFVTLTWAVLSLIAVVGAFRLTVATDVTKWFPPGDPVRDAWDTIRDRLSGLTPVNVVVESHNGLPVTDPAALDAIDGLSQYLAGLGEVGKAVSVADPLRQIHGGFIGDESAPLPRERELIDQYLLLLDSVEQLGDVVTPGREAANIVLRVDNNGSEALRELNGKVGAWWAVHGAGGFDARLTGIMFEFARAEDEIAFGQLRGLVFAVGGIGAILLIVFRQPLLVGAALAVNFAPLMLVFGALGWLEVPLDAGTVLVANLAIGIAVDDTIHVISSFLSRLAAGDPRPVALSNGLRAVLPAVVSTTIVVTAGFAVLGLSPFAFTRNLGVVTAVVMIVCLAADVILLPALLLGIPTNRLVRKAAEGVRSGQEKALGVR
jgi:uncharacterized protein